ncbi:MAG: nucleotide exchange factor GrpE [Syntrophaceae bacterium]|nr:nucleotide exchange factor GrpE [Syntrophaceae bacterium]HQF84580.1 nucleotide exchange factor GrpE [Smithellaceae bacterium]HQG81713.1 nucleotide exchange factor GrpE [Smithellaceae bacterium]
MKVKKEQTEKKIKVAAPEKDDTGGLATDAEINEVDMLKEQLEAKEAKAKENYDLYLRAMAEMDNLRKRTAREKADTIKYGKEEIIKDILPFLDSMDRALEHADTSDARTFIDGIRLMQDQLLCCLQKHGVERIESMGEDFDPNLHEALMLLDSADHRDNQIVSEMEKGYLLNGRLIRPSRVCVCKRDDNNNNKSNIQ